MGGVMPYSATLSVNTLLNKAVRTLNLTSLGQEKRQHLSVNSSNNPLENVENELLPINTLQISTDDRQSHIDSKHLTIRDKVLHHNLLTTYQPHLLHYAMKSVGLLPEAVLDSLVGYLDGPTAKQYEHVDAHLRLILAVNSKLNPFTALRDG